MECGCILGYSTGYANNNYKIMRINFGRYTIKLELFYTVTYLICCALLVSLGFWQLDRSEQKRVFLKLEEQRASSDVVQLSKDITSDSDSLRYKKIFVDGGYDTEHQFLIDNQINEGKVGYYVLTPFILKDRTGAVLINRGWLASGLERSKLPDIKLTQPEAHIVGRINHFPSVGIKLSGAEIPSDGWPSLVQVVNSKILSEKLGYALYDFQIELDKDIPDGYKRDWHAATVMLPEQHTAYAIQWFLLALTLTIIFIWYSLKIGR